MLPPNIDATTLALFTAFSVSVTQLMKQEDETIKNIYLYLISSGTFIAAALIYASLPFEWHTFFLMILGGISVPGTVGLVKEIRRDGGRSDVTVTDAQNVNANAGSRVSVSS